MSPTVSPPPCFRLNCCHVICCRHSWSPEDGSSRPPEFYETSCLPQCHSCECSSVTVFSSVYWGNLVCLVHTAAVQGAATSWKSLETNRCLRSHITSKPSVPVDHLRRLHSAAFVFHTWNRIVQSFFMGRFQLTVNNTIKIQYPKHRFIFLSHIKSLKIPIPRSASIPMTSHTGLNTKRRTT